MRVAEATKHKTVQANLNQNAGELQEIQTALSNGKKLNKPSDDPIGAALVQDYKTSIDHAKNVEKNIGMDKVWLDASENAIGHMAETMMKIKTMAMEGGTGGASAEERNALANEIELVVKDMVKIGNSKKGKLFLFSGTKTFTEPLKMNARIKEAQAYFMGTRIKSQTKTIPLNQDKPLGLQPGKLVINLTPTLEKAAELKAIADEKAALVAADKAAKAEAAKLAGETPDAAAAEDAAKEISNAEEAALGAGATEGAEAAKEGEAAATPVEGEAAAAPTEEAAPAEAPAEGEEAAPNHSITIEVTAEDSLKDLVKKINEAAIAQEGYTEDEHSALGFRSRLTAEIGTDNSLYLDPTAGYQFSFASDATGFAEKMGFVTLKGTSLTVTATEEGEEPPEAEAEAPAEGEEGAAPVQAAPLVLDQEMYKAEFKGYSKESYLVKVVQGGTYGKARYVVSDDGGNTWSKIQALNKQTEIYDPEGKANNKVVLQFNAEGEPFFKEGVEFHFEGNEFVEYKGNEQIKQVPIDNGIKVALNITANELFYKHEGDEETINSFDVLNRLIESLHDDDPEAVLESLNNIDTSVNQLLKKQSQVGSTLLELESSEERIGNDMDAKAAEVSELEDLDMAKGAIDLNKAELKHQVSLDSAARLIQPTLINFLK